MSSPNTQMTRSRFGDERREVPFASSLATPVVNETQVNAVDLGIPSHGGGDPFVDSRMECRALHNYSIPHGIHVRRLPRPARRLGTADDNVSFLLDGAKPARGTLDVHSADGRSAFDRHLNRKSANDN